MTFNDIFKSSFSESVSEFFVLDTIIDLALTPGGRSLVTTLVSYNGEYLA